jgi:hypothetical protein
MQSSPIVFFFSPQRIHVDVHFVVEHPSHINFCFTYQAYKFIHAQWAILGAAGFVLLEAFNKFGAVCGLEAVWWKVCEKAHYDRNGSFTVAHYTRFECNVPCIL